MMMINYRIDQDGGEDDDDGEKDDDDGGGGLSSHLTATAVKVGNDVEACDHRAILPGPQLNVHHALQQIHPTELPLQVRAA